MKTRLSISILLALNVWFLSACTPIIQGVSTISTTVFLANDRRSVGVILDDKVLNNKLATWADKDVKLKQSHLNFLVYDKVVLITGELANADLRDYVQTQIMTKWTKIKRLVNETVISPNSGIISRTKDTFISAQIELAFQNQEVFHPTHVKVITENQSVYLMGQVTSREAQIATKIAADVSAVVKVVKIFDYLKSRPQAEIERDRLEKIAEEKAASAPKPTDGTNFSPGQNSGDARP